MSNPENSPEYGSPMSPSEFMELVELEGRITPSLGMTAIKSMLDATANGDKASIAEWQTTYAAAANYNSERAALQAQAAADIQAMNPHDTSTSRELAEYFPPQEGPTENPAA